MMVVVVQQVLRYIVMYIVGNEELIGSVVQLIRRKLLAVFIRLANLPYSSSDFLCEVFMLVKSQYKISLQSADNV
jgi:hypothetical protein